MEKATLARWSQGLAQARQGRPPFDMPLAIAEKCAPENRRAASLFSGAAKASGAPSIQPKVHLDGAVQRALALREEGVSKVGILVFCSAKRAGGGWLSGAFAQEEAIAMSSTWGLDCFCPCFHQARHLDYFYGDAVVGLDGFLLAREPGLWLPQPEAVFFVGFAAPNMKALREAGEDPTSPENKRKAQRAFNAREPWRRSPRRGATASCWGPLAAGCSKTIPSLWPKLGARP